jgi:hypothetical protein
MPTPISWPLTPPAPATVATQFAPAPAISSPWGMDISALPDLDPSFTLQTGGRVLAEALARRLSTPGGSLGYDPDYGFDLREELNAKFGPGATTQLAGQIQSEVVKDERVITALATVTLNAAANTLGVVLQLGTTRGPFSLTLGVSAVTVALIDFSGGASFAFTQFSSPIRG